MRPVIKNHDFKNPVLLTYDNEAGVLIKDCTFTCEGLPVPEKLWARVKFCFAVLFGKVKSIQRVCNDPLLDLNVAEIGAE